MDEQKDVVEESSLEDSIELVKKQLRFEKKETIITQWVVMYLQNDLLRRQISELKKLIVKQESASVDADNSATPSGVEGESK